MVIAQVTVAITDRITDPTTVMDTGTTTDMVPAMELGMVPTTGTRTMAIQYVRATQTIRAKVTATHTEIDRS